MNSALYFPWLRAVDPLAPGGARDFPPSGAVAGVFARVDAARGVAKAPAGTGANVQGALALATTISDADAARLARSASTPCACSRRRASSSGERGPSRRDAAASEWKYVPVRRLALFIEESLSRGLAWAAFEPNAEPLWAALRSAVEAFLTTLWRNGALLGTDAAEAGFVKCDATTMTAADIALGTVRLVVGFAPLKPAEFVVLTIEQRAAPSAEAAHAAGRAQTTIAAPANRSFPMKCVSGGSRYFGATVFEALRKEDGVEFAASSPRRRTTGSRSRPRRRACRCTCSRTRRSCPATRSPKAPT